MLSDALGPQRADAAGARGKFAADAGIGAQTSHAFGPLVAFPALGRER